MNDLTSSMERLEMIAFFGGYPLLYFVIHFVAGNQLKRTILKNRLITLLPLAYALVGTLYLGLQLKDWYPDYNIKHIASGFQYPYLKIWGLLSLIFWIPPLFKKPVFSLLHSLVFFFLLIQDLYVQFFSSAADKHIIKNDMKVYTDSLLLNLLSFVVVSVIYFLLVRFRNKKNSVRN